MRIIDCVQGSPEWLQARLGLPTASAFDRICTPGGKACKGDTVRKFLNHLVAEWFIGEPMDDYTSAFMARGKDMEAEAADWYAFRYSCDPERVGLCLTDDGRAGCSPDRLIGSLRGLEIKCPGAATHVGYVLDNTALVDDYRVQAQGQIWVMKWERVDLLSFHPTMPKVVVEVEPDAEYQRLLSDAVPAFCDALDAAKRTLAKEKAAYDAARARRQQESEDEIPAGIC